MNPLIRLKATSALLITLALLCFELLPKVQAVVPPPDGGYPGGNTAEGQNALFRLTTGGFNTGVGFLSLRSVTTGTFNTGVGAGTLLANTGDNNTATGAGALLSNTTGTENTSTGAFALSGNTIGDANTAVGHQVLTSNTTGGGNTAIGHRSLTSNTTGGSNTAVGVSALLLNTEGFDNTAIGVTALVRNTSGYNNTATGEGALWNNTVGFYNTANGVLALYLNEGGSDNTAVGRQALYLNRSGVGNTAIGAQALVNNTSGSYNVALFGGQNLTTGNFNIDIGNDGVAGESNTIRIGNPLHNRAFVAGINGATVSSGAAVYINSDGQLGTNTSSARFKQDIQTMDRTSEVLLAFRPVIFRYKPELDPKGISQFGLVGEEVEKLNPDLIVRDKDGKPYSVRYEQINAMLLNEFLKEHRKNEEQGRDIQEQKATIALQQKQIDALTAGLQKVSTHLELGKASAKTAFNR